MEWGNIENRNTVIGLHSVVCQKAFYSYQLALLPIGMSRMFVYRAVKLIKESSGVVNRQRFGRPRIVRTPEAVKTVESNPLRNQKSLSREMKISRSSVSHIIKIELKLGA